MNHLAHLVLAGPDEGLRLGAVLGDHVKGRLLPERWPAEWPLDWRRGIELHRFIDSRCDRHPAVQSLLGELESPWRRYGGIILDVLFDHMLDRHWDRFGPMPIEIFAAEVDGLLGRYRPLLPHRVQRFAVWASARQLWRGYGNTGLLEEIFSLIAQRHARPSPLARGLEILQHRDEQIEAVFFELFGDLSGQVAEWKRVRRDADQFNISSM